MIKFLPLIIVILLFLGGLYYFRARSVSPTPSLGVPFSQTSSSNLTSSQTTTEERLKTLEEAVTYLLKQNGKSDKATSQLSAGEGNFDPTIENRLKLLETTVGDLKQKVLVTPTVSPNSKKPPVYIPLGGNWTTSDKTGLVLPQFKADIDPSEYSGYTSMVLEVNMRLTQQSGTLYANLYNVTDSSDVASSQISTASDQYNLYSSWTFTLPAGKKTYSLKIKTSNSVDANIQMARIKVNF